MIVNNIIRNIIGCVLVFAVLIGSVCVAGTVETTYTMDAEIIAISEEEVSLIDSMGEDWVFFGQGFRIGDSVRVRFFTNGTDDTRLDDVIENVKNF